MFNENGIGVCHSLANHACQHSLFNENTMQRTKEAREMNDIPDFTKTTSGMTVGFHERRSDKILRS